MYITDPALSVLHDPSPRAAPGQILTIAVLTMLIATPLGVGLAVGGRDGAGAVHGRPPLHARPVDHAPKIIMASPCCSCSPACRLDLTDALGRPPIATPDGIAITAEILDELLARRTVAGRPADPDDD